MGNAGADGGDRSRSRVLSRQSSNSSMLSRKSSELGLRPFSSSPHFRPSSPAPSDTPSPTGPVGPIVPLRLRRPLTPVYGDPDMSSLAAAAPRHLESSAKSLAKSAAVELRRQAKQEDEGERNVKEAPTSDCYVPSPMVTFLVDSAELQCQICCDSKLALHSKTSKVRDTQPASLPCGHCLGHRCLLKWLRNWDFCPVCRLTLRYKGCNHKIEPRVIDAESIFSTPLTLPAGGAIGNYCRDCQQKRVDGRAYRKLKSSFQQAREAWRKAKSEETKEAMKAAQAEFERLAHDRSVARLRTEFTTW